MSWEARVAQGMDPYAEITEEQRERGRKARSPSQPKRQTNTQQASTQQTRQSSVPSGGGRFSPEQIATAAYQAGFRGNALINAIAIALGESSGRPGAVGDVHLQTSKWGPSLGLWQVRTLNDMKGTGGWRDASRLHDPMFNAQAAYAISGQGKNFTPWTVYNKGIHRQFLDVARHAATRVSGGEFADLPSGPALSQLSFGGGPQDGRPQLPMTLSARQSPSLPSLAKVSSQFMSQQRQQGRPSTADPLQSIAQGHQPNLSPLHRMARGESDMDELVRTLAGTR